MQKAPLVRGFFYGENSQPTQAAGRPPVLQVHGLSQPRVNLSILRDRHAMRVSCQNPPSCEPHRYRTHRGSIRNAISIGGDSDTLAAIAGGVAEARFGISAKLASHARPLLPPEMQRVIEQLYERVS